MVKQALKTLNAASFSKFAWHFWDVICIKEFYFQIQKNIKMKRNSGMK